MTGVHKLFVGHARLTRSVTVPPDGIRTVTESVVDTFHHIPSRAAHSPG